MSESNQAKKKIRNLTMCFDYSTPQKPKIDYKERIRLRYSKRDHRVIQY